MNTIGKEQALWYSAAIFAGIMLWDIFMATSIHFGRRFINHTVMKWISIVAGIVLIMFGIYFGYEAVRGINRLL